MKRFYHDSPPGFYDSHSALIPEGAVEISLKARGEMHAAILKGNIYRIIDGQIVKDGPVPPTIDELSADERHWRDAALASAVGLRDRHRDQLEIGVDTTISAEQFTELLIYMQALRDWPQSPYFPDIQQRPAPPAWIAEQA